MELTDYLDLTEEEILQKMFDRLPDLDKTEGSYIWDALAPVALEMVILLQGAREMLKQVFASTATGKYLDLRCDEHGITRKPATKATGQVKFSGTAGTVIPAGTKVGTEATTERPTVEFETIKEGKIDSGGSAVIDIVAMEAGTKGNVAANTIKVLVTPVSGVSSVTNEAATTNAVNTESDADLLQRYYLRVRNPSASGNKADYVNWSLEVSGVGGVSVVPVRDGSGTVSVAIIGTDKKPAGQSVIDKAQDYISPPHKKEYEAEDMTRSGYGTSIDTSQTDDTGDSVKMEYNSSGDGKLTHTDVKSLLPQPGIWTARPRVKVDSTSKTVAFFEVGMYNVSAGGWCKDAPKDGNDAVMTKKASELTTSFGELVQKFYWNGSDNVELRITRKTADDATKVWVDRARYVSAFSKVDGDGKAPIGAQITIEAATSILINITATLTIAAGYDAASVKATVKTNLENYIKNLAFTVNNDVVYTRVGSTILDTEGVQDYKDLTVNGGTVNVVIKDQEVAVPGTITLNS